MTGWMSVLADATPSPSPIGPPIDENLISPGFLGFLSFVFLIVAVALLYRSMTKQLKKVRPDLPEGPSDVMRDEDRRIIAEAQERGAEQERRARQAPEAGSDG